MTTTDTPTWIIARSIMDDWINGNRTHAARRAVACDNPALVGHAALEITHEKGEADAREFALQVGNADAELCGRSTA